MKYDPRSRVTTCLLELTITKFKVGLVTFHHNWKQDDFDDDDNILDVFKDLDNHISILIFHSSVYISDGSD